MTAPSLPAGLLPNPRTPVLISLIYGSIRNASQKSTQFASGYNRRPSVGPIMENKTFAKHCIHIALILNQFITTIKVAGPSRDMTKDNASTKSGHLLTERFTALRRSTSFIFPCVQPSPPAYVKQDSVLIFRVLASTDQLTL
jgi:hypothetical protein